MTAQARSLKLQPFTQEEFTVFAMSYVQELCKLLESSNKLLLAR